MLREDEKLDGVKDSEILSARDSIARLRILHEILRPHRLTRIVDVGANPLEPAVYNDLLELNIAEVWAFEPQDGPYQKLMEEPKTNQHVFPNAIGNGSEGVLNVCRSSGFTSMLTSNHDFFEYMNTWRRGLKVVEQINIQTTRLDDLVELPKPDLLKIDIQGGEMDVFLNAKEKLSDVLAVVTEVAAIQLYENQPLLDEQMRVMRELGLDLHKFLFFKEQAINHASSSKVRHRRIRGQLIDGDAAFIRSLLKLKEMSSEHLKHLALINDGVIQSYDLVLHILHILEGKGEVKDEDIDKYIKHLPKELVRN